MLNNNYSKLPSVVLLHGLFNLYLKGNVVTVLVTVRARFWSRLQMCRNLRPAQLTASN